MPVLSRAGILNAREGREGKNYKDYKKKKTRNKIVLNNIIQLISIYQFKRKTKHLLKFLSIFVLRIFFTRRGRRGKEIKP